MSAALFAGVHFQLTQFPGLLVLGLTPAWLSTRTAGLGAPIWALVGFNATTTAILLLQ